MAADDQKRIQFPESVPYPKKPLWFARRFVRILYKSGAVNDVGLDGLVLLTHVAMTEDGIDYRYAPKFWTKELVDCTGLCRQTIHRAITTCVRFNWLHYEPGAKARAMVMFTKVPTQVSDWWDKMDCGSNPSISAEKNAVNFGDRIATECEQNQGRIRAESATHSKTNTNTTISTPTQLAEVDFRSLEKQLIHAGVSRAKETIQKALSNGSGLEQIRDVIAYYSSRPGAWGPGGLCTRITLGSAHSLAPEQGWPTPDPRETDLRVKKAIASDRDKTTAQAQANAVRKRTEAQLELEFGPILDALEKDQVIQLASDRRPALAPQLRRYGWPPGSGWRKSLLHMLAEEAPK